MSLPLFRGWDGGGMGWASSFPRFGPACLIWLTAGEVPLFHGWDGHGHGLFLGWDLHAILLIAGQIPVFHGWDGHGSYPLIVSACLIWPDLVDSRSDPSVPRTG